MRLKLLLPLSLDKLFKAYNLQIISKNPKAFEYLSVEIPYERNKYMLRD